jgi:hypothetical protein
MVCDGGILNVVDTKDGAFVYRRRLGAVGQYRSSPVVAGGHLYAISEKGVISVVRTGDEFQLVDQHDLRETVAATPAIDESTLYLRTRTQLLAFRRG